MAKNNNKPALFVVDGSNVATEGRSQPSLEQLNEAVAAFKEEYPDVKVTVVVDATFGHRISKKEVKAFDAAVAQNELVTPPAGAVGRGDAFILAIAHKAKAGVFSNDSFQEFHGDYEWLFDPGRLIGGKPVPHVGWVFVDRNPVRGPKSRESIKAAKQAATVDGDPTEAKEQARRRIRKKGAARPADEAVVEPVRSAPVAEPEVAAPPKGDPVNDLMAFLEFVEHHAVGTHVTGTVDRYSSHGSYAKVDDVLVYVPLRLMADPPPTSARKVVQLGDEIDLVVMAFNPERRSIDAALASMASAVERPATSTATDASDAAAESAGAKKRRSSRRRGKKPAGDATDSGSAPLIDAAVAPSQEPSTPAASTAASDAAEPTSPRKASARRAPARTKAAAAGGSGESKAAATPPAEAPATTRAPKQAAKAAAEQPAAKKAPAKQSAKQAAAKRSPDTQPADKQPTAKKAPAKKAPAKKAPAKKAAAKKAPAKKSPATKAAAKQAQAGGAGS